MGLWLKKKRLWPLQILRIPMLHVNMILYNKDWPLITGTGGGGAGGGGGGAGGGGRGI